MHLIRPPRRSHKPTAAVTGHKKKGTPGAEPIKNVKSNPPIHFPEGK